MDELFAKYDKVTEQIVQSAVDTTSDSDADVCPHGPGRNNCEQEDCIEWRAMHGRAR